MGAGWGFHGENGRESIEKRRGNSMELPQFGMKMVRLSMNKENICLRGTKFKRLSLIGALLLLFSLSGCAHMFGLAYYDPTTYKSLTDLKPEVKALYDTFTKEIVNAEKIDSVRLKLAQIYEYEKGKGEKNADTTKQIKIIQEMLERHVNSLLTQGKWNYSHLINQKENMAEAFDIAIQTERLKNKNE